MTGRFAGALIALLVYLVVLRLAAAALAAGLSSDGTLALWAGAISAADGEMSIGAIVAAYPTIPFLSTTLMQFLVPAGSPTPAVLAAAIACLVGGLWYRAIRGAGFGAPAAGLATLLLAFNPLVLRAALTSPSDMFLVLFLYLFGAALYDLRNRGNVPEVMTVGLTLLGVAFSHPMGAAIALASLPFLAFALRPLLVAHAPLNVVLTLVFPTVFAAGAFAYVSWVFPGDGWSFFAPPAESVSAWLVGFARMFAGGPTGLPSLDTGLVIAAVLPLAAPLAPVAVGWVQRRRPLVMPAIAFALTAVMAAMLAVALKIFGEPPTIAVMAPVLAAVLLVKVPVARERRRAVIALLIAGWFGSALTLGILEPRALGSFATAITGSGIDRGRADSLALGGTLAGWNDVLIDTFNAPAVVVGRQSARGLIGPGSDRFGLAVLLQRLDAQFVAVPDPQSAEGAHDRLNKAFPTLYREGAPGYRLVYHNNTWRIFATSNHSRIYKE